MGMNCAYDKLTLVKAAMVGKILSDLFKQRVAYGNKVAGNEYQLLVAALHSKSRNGDRCFDLS